jgi:hypothetical protein
MDKLNFAELFYPRLLLSWDAGVDVLLSDRSVAALRYAVQRMRADVEMTLDGWVNWVRYGT